MTHMITRRTAADGSETWMELTSKKLLRRAMELSKARADGGPDCSSIPKLALAAGLSNATVGHLVSDTPSGRKTCTVDTAERIAAALGWSPDELFVMHKRPTQNHGGNAEAAA